MIVMGPKKKFLQGALVMPVAKKFGTTASEIIEVVNKGNFEVYVVDFGEPHVQEPLLIQEFHKFSHSVDDNNQIR